MVMLQCRPSHFLNSARAALYQSASFSTGRYEKLKRRQNTRLAVGRGRDVFPAEFITRLKSWPNLLQKEIEANRDQLLVSLKSTGNDWSGLEQRGLALGGLKVVEQRFDPLRGHLKIFSLGLRNRRRAKGFRSGTPVLVCAGPDLRPVLKCRFVSLENNSLTLSTLPQSGTVYNLSTEQEFALLPSEGSGPIETLQKILVGNFAKDVPGEELVQYAFRGKQMPSIHNDRVPSSLTGELNHSQTLAVAAALNKKRPFVCIQGPPGTGKTRVVAEVIRQLVQKNQKVLVCAPTHVAVDNALQKTMEVTNLARGQDYDPLDCLSEDYGDESVATSEDIDDAIRSHDKYSQLMLMAAGITENNKDDKLRGEFKKLKWQIYKSCYKRRTAIFCTISSSVVQKLEKLDWVPDVVIIDEAAMCIEPWTWAALLKAKRCILVGDQSQLPAIVISEQARKENLHVSLMERLIKSFPQSNLVHMLTTQYRMNKSIMRWSSDTFYDSQLEAHEDVADITLSDISTMPPDHPLNEPLMMINTDISTPRNLHCSLFQEESFQMSFRNTGEAELIADYVRLLISHGVSKKSIGVITPYHAQTQLIRELLDDSSYTVNTVDSFQGQEREVMLFSMVRYNAERTIGFLRDARRMNVAVTRARRQFVLFGSAQMMKTNKNLRSLHRAIETHGKVNSPMILRVDEELGQSPLRKEAVAAQ